MYLSLGKAAKEAGVAKSTISKALSSGKLSYREKNSDGYKIDPAELFRVYPKIAKTDADEPASNDWQSGQADGETTPYSAKFEIQLAGLKSLIAEKDRRITDLEADRVQLREDRHRLTENWQEERVRLLKLLEDQTLHRKASDRREGKAGRRGSTHVLAAGFPPQAGDGGLRISAARRAKVVAVLGGSNTSGIDL